MEIIAKVKSFGNPKIESLLSILYKNNPTIVFYDDHNDFILLTTALRSYNIKYNISLEEEPGNIIYLVPYSRCTGWKHKYTNTIIFFSTPHKLSITECCKNRIDCENKYIYFLEG